MFVVERVRCAVGAKERNGRNESSKGVYGTKRSVVNGGMKLRKQFRGEEAVASYRLRVTARVRGFRAPLSSFRRLGLFRDLPGAA